jgi:hypothetical protein
VVIAETRSAKADFPPDDRIRLTLYLVRRSRTFVEENYSRTDPKTKQVLPRQNGREHDV